MSMTSPHSRMTLTETRFSLESSISRPTSMSAATPVILSWGRRARPRRPLKQNYARGGRIPAPNFMHATRERLSKSSFGPPIRA